MNIKRVIKPELLCAFLVWRRSSFVFLVMPFTCIRFSTKMSNSNVMLYSIVALMLHERAFAVLSSCPITFFCRCLHIPFSLRLKCVHTFSIHLKLYSCKCIISGFLTPCMHAERGTAWVNQWTENKERCAHRNYRTEIKWRHIELMNRITFIWLDI